MYQTQLKYIVLPKLDSPVLASCPSGMAGRWLGDLGGGDSATI